MNRLPASVPALSIALALGLPAAPFAAEPVQPPAETDSDPATESTYRAGHPVGSFLLRPELAAGLLYDSNIFATRSDEVDDIVTLFTPAVTLVSDWERHRLQARTGATLARYRDNEDEDYEDYWAELEGRYDISEASNVFGGVGYTAGHEDRGSPDETLVGDEPTTFDSRHAHAGVAHKFGEFNLRLGGTFEALDYDSVGPLNNDDRDRDLIGLGARLGYEFHPDYEAYVQLIRDIRSYNDPVDDFGYQRDSDGERIALGFKGRFTNRLQGGAYVGWIRQAWDDSRFNDLSAPDFSGALSFRATPRTTVSAAVDRTLEETTLPGASGYLYTEASVNASHRLDSRTRFSAGLSAGEADYRDIGRKDMLYSASAGLRYYLTPRLYLDAGYRVITRDSNTRLEVNNPANLQEIDDYSRQQFFLTLGTLLYPIEGMPEAFPASPDRLAFAGPGWGGLYAGARIGQGAHLLRTEGVRGNSIDHGEFSDEGLAAGAFAGYGLDLGRWYLGLELEGEDTGGDIYHRKAKADSRTQDLEVGETLGLALRGGYRLAGGTLFYARLGRVETDFKTFYTLNNAPANAVSRTFEQDGLRYGLGTDIPAGERLFVRLEYTYTRYDDYTVDVVSDQEDFNPKSSFFNLGLGWHLGGSRSREPGPERVALRGFYAGGQLGHGALNSHLTGSHIDSGSGPFAFTGDFGDNSGFTGGVFAGIGNSWNRWYLGLEAELEASDADWKHIRDPNGRNFDVARKNGYGLGLRGGYQLDNGTLLYVRAGRVRSRFATGWVKGGNPDNDIDRDDTVSGNRFGVGADIPATRSLFLRLDYSHTDYEDYGFTTSHGSSDSMNFDTSEALFRLGLGARF